MYKLICIQCTVLCITLSTILAQNDDMQSRLESLFNCKYDSDCSENSFCFGNDEVTLGKCRCKANYVTLERNRTFIECLPASEGIGSPCLKDVQCQVTMGILSFCTENDKTCRCNSEAHLGDDNRCYRTTNIGGLCESDFNCLTSDNKQGYCVDGKCTCGNKQHLKDDNTCIPAALLGESCTAGEFCLKWHSNCYGGICKCMGGYIESNNNSVCLHAANKVGDECTEESQCNAYIIDSFCTNGKCSCKSNYHGYGNECVVNAKLGERCFYDKECILSAELQYSLKCQNEVCTCVEGLSDSNDYGCIIVKSHSTIKLISFELFSILVLGNTIKYLL